MRFRATVQIQKDEYDSFLKSERDSWLDETDVDNALAVELNWTIDVQYGSLDYTLEVMHGNTLVATHNLVCD